MDRYFDGELFVGWKELCDDITAAVGPSNGSLETTPLEALRIRAAMATQRCGHSHLYGLPAKIATTDKFQGQQNDYILLSLVRTKAVGHLRSALQAALFECVGACNTVYTQAGFTYCGGGPWTSGTGAEASLYGDSSVGGPVSLLMSMVTTALLTDVSD